VTVRLHNGETIRRRLDDVIAATPQEIRARFREAATVVIGTQRAHELEQLVDNCERLADCSGIAALCRLDLPQASEFKTGAALKTAGVPARGSQ